MNVVGSDGGCCVGGGGGCCCGRGAVAVNDADLSWLVKCTHQQSVGLFAVILFVVVVAIEMRVRLIFVVRVIAGQSNSIIVVEKM